MTQGPSLYPRVFSEVDAAVERAVAAGAELAATLQADGLRWREALQRVRADLVEQRDDPLSSSFRRAVATSMVQRLDEALRPPAPPLSLEPLATRPL